MSRRPYYLVPVFVTEYGKMICADSLLYLRRLPSRSVDLVITSPPYALLTQREYGNEAAGTYVQWFMPFAHEIKRVLKPNGSFVLNVAGGWNRDIPTRNVYHYKLVIALLDEIGFHLAQEAFWWNPARIPTPPEWVNVRRIRIKEAVESLFWFSPTPWPKSSNTRVLQPFSESWQSLMNNLPRARRMPMATTTPSSHRFHWQKVNNTRAAIPPNLLIVPNSSRSRAYADYCRRRGYPRHPATFPTQIPEFFIRMLTNEDDLVIDPFAGSCTTGVVCERLSRRWVCIDRVRGYLLGARERFNEDVKPSNTSHIPYRIQKLDALWHRQTRYPVLDCMGGRYYRSWLHSQRGGPHEY